MYQNFSHRAILVVTVSQNSLVFALSRAVIARYVEKWGITQTCLCKTKCQGRYRTGLEECEPAWRDIARYGVSTYRSGSIATLRGIIWTLSNHPSILIYNLGCVIVQLAYATVQWTRCHALWQIALVAIIFRVLSQAGNRFSGWSTRNTFMQISKHVQQNMWDNISLLPKSSLCGTSLVPPPPQVRAKSCVPHLRATLNSNLGANPPGTLVRATTPQLHRSVSALFESEKTAHNHIHWFIALSLPCYTLSDISHSNSRFAWCVLFP